MERYGVVERRTRILTASMFLYWKMCIYPCIYVGVKTLVVAEGTGAVLCPVCAGQVLDGLDERMKLRRSRRITLVREEI